MLKPFLVGLLCSGSIVALWPSAADAQQFGRNTYIYSGSSQSGWNHRQRSFGGAAYDGGLGHRYPRSWQRNGYSPYFDRSERIDGFRRPATVIIIQQPPVYAYPASTCSTSVVGSPIPLPYARDTRTGLPCN